MGRIQFSQYKDKKILVEDFTNLVPGNEFMAALETAKNMIRSQPPKSVLALFDATGSRFDNPTMAEMKAFVKGNNPYIKAAAVVGIQGLLNIALTAVSKFSGRGFRTFKDRQSALEWLIMQ